MAPKLIYIADDEENIRNLVKTFLENGEYQVEAFENGDLLFETFLEKPCDLVVLDVMMPGSSGFDVCTRLREISIVPIIMLTARDTDVDYIRGITLGSDDYFTKPFSPMSLVMRVKAIFRRIDLEKGQAAVFAGGEKEVSLLSFGDLTLDLDHKTVCAGETPLALTPSEYNLLVYLVENRDKAVSREELLEKVWGYVSEVETRAADDTVKRLRKKMAASRVVIETVWGFGFRLNEKEKGQ